MIGSGRAPAGPVRARRRGVGTRGVQFRGGPEPGAGSARLRLCRLRALLSPGRERAQEVQGEARVLGHVNGPRARFHGLLTGDHHGHHARGHAGGGSGGGVLHDHAVLGRDVEAACGLEVGVRIRLGGHTLRHLLVADDHPEQVVRGAAGSVARHLRGGVGDDRGGDSGPVQLVEQGLDPRDERGRVLGQDLPEDPVELALDLLLAAGDAQFPEPADGVRQRHPQGVPGVLIGPLPAVRGRDPLLSPFPQRLGVHEGAVVVEEDGPGEL